MAELRELYLYPSDIRYPQDSIRPYFSDGRSLRNTVRSYSEGREDLDMGCLLKVVFYKGRYWTLNNRSLWVYQQLEKTGVCQKIKVKEVGFVYKVWNQHYSTTTDGLTVKIRDKHLIRKDERDTRKENEHLHLDSCNEDDDVTHLRMGQVDISDLNRAIHTDLTPPKYNSRSLQYQCRRVKVHIRQHSPRNRTAYQNESECQEARLLEDEYWTRRYDESTSPSPSGDLSDENKIFVKNSQDQIPQEFKGPLSFDFQDLDSDLDTVKDSSQGHVIQSSGRECTANCLDPKRGRKRKREQRTERKISEKQLAQDVSYWEHGDSCRPRSNTKIMRRSSRHKDSGSRRCSTNQEPERSNSGQDLSDPREHQVQCNTNTGSPPALNWSGSPQHCRNRSRGSHSQNSTYKERQVNKIHRMKFKTQTREHSLNSPSSRNSVCNSKSRSPVQSVRGSRYRGQAKSHTTIYDLYRPEIRKLSSPGTRSRSPSYDYCRPRHCFPRTHINRFQHDSPQYDFCRSRRGGQRYESSESENVIPEYDFHRSRSRPNSPKYDFLRSPNNSPNYDLHRSRSNSPNYDFHRSRYNSPNYDFHRSRSNSLNYDFHILRSTRHDIRRSRSCSIRYETQILQSVSPRYCSGRPQNESQTYDSSWSLTSRPRYDIRTSQSSCAKYSSSQTRNGNLIYDVPKLQSGCTQNFTNSENTESSHKIQVEYFPEKDKVSDFQAKNKVEFPFSPTSPKERCDKKTIYFKPNTPSLKTMKQDNRNEEQYLRNILLRDLEKKKLQHDNDVTKPQNEPKQIENPTFPGGPLSSKSPEHKSISTGADWTQPKGPPKSPLKLGKNDAHFSALQTGKNYLYQNFVMSNFEQSNTWVGENHTYFGAIVAGRNKERLAEIKRKKYDRFLRSQSFAPLLPTEIEHGHLGVNNSYPKPAENFQSLKTSNIPGLNKQQLETQELQFTRNMDKKISQCRSGSRNTGEQQLMAPFCQQGFHNTPTDQRHGSPSSEFVLGQHQLNDFNAMKITHMDNKPPWLPIRQISNEMLHDSTLYQSHQNVLCWDRNYKAFEEKLMQRSYMSPSTHVKNDMGIVKAESHDLLNNKETLSSQQVIKSGSCKDVSENKEIIPVSSGQERSRSSSILMYTDESSNTVVTPFQNQFQISPQLYTPWNAFHPGTLGCIPFPSDVYNPFYNAYNYSQAISQLFWANRTRDPFLLSSPYCLDMGLLPLHHLWVSNLLAQANNSLSASFNSLPINYPSTQPLTNLMGANVGGQALNQPSQSWPQLPQTSSYSLEAVEQVLKITRNVNQSGPGNHNQNSHFQSATNTRSLNEMSAGSQWVHGNNSSLVSETRESTCLTQASNDIRHHSATHVSALKMEKESGAELPTS